MSTVTLNKEHHIVGAWTPDQRGYGQERIHTYVKFFEADYYGKGAKLYASGYKRIEYTVNDETRYGPVYGHWQEGNDHAVQCWLDKVQAT